MRRISMLIVLTVAFLSTYCSDGEDNQPAPQSAGTGATGGGVSGSGGTDQLVDTNSGGSGAGGGSGGGGIVNTGGTTNQNSGGTEIAGGTGGTGPSCGNGTLEDGERCEIGVSFVETCLSLGHGEGTLSCDPTTCEFDVSACGIPTGQDGPDASSNGGSGGSSSGQLLPPVDDPGDTGPFEIQVVETLDGLPTHILIAPRDLGRDGIKHPILVWINGAMANSSSYRNMHDNVAAHGFFLLDDKQSTMEAIPEIDSQRAAIDWAIAQAQDPNSPYYGKIDETRIAIGGHSLGSVASFGNVDYPPVTTSVHMAGGVIGNPGGVDNSKIEDLRVPTMFLCGSVDTNGLPRVRNDFAAAPPDVPLFFGILDGVGHLDEFSRENGGRWGRIFVAWLRWQLADDESAKALFVGEDCEFCTGDWTTMKRGLD